MIFFPGWAIVFLGAVGIGLIVVAFYLLRKLASLEATANELADRGGERVRVATSADEE